MVSPDRHVSKLRIDAVTRRRRTNLTMITAANRDRRSLAISALISAWLGQLLYLHHQRNKSACGGFHFLSNHRFDTVAVQTALLGPISQVTRLRGLCRS